MSSSSLSALRKICLMNPDRGGYAMARSQMGVAFNWRFNHGVGPRVSKRIATHMEPLAIPAPLSLAGCGKQVQDVTPSYAYYSVGDSYEAKRCLHLLIAENYAFCTPMVFHDIVPSVDHTAYRFYLDLESSDADVVSAMSSSAVLSPQGVASAVQMALKRVLAKQAGLGGGEIDEKLLEVVVFDASRSGVKYSTHLVFPNLVQERNQQASIQARLLEDLLDAADGSASKLVARLIDRGGNSSQPRLRMPFCDKVAGVSPAGEPMCAHRILEYAGTFGPGGVYADFSADAVESVMDLHRSIERVGDDDDGSGSESSDCDDGDDGAGCVSELRALVKTAFPWSFWLIPSRLLPKTARLARVTMMRHAPELCPDHPDAEKIADVLDRTCLVPLVPSDGASVLPRAHIYEAYASARSSSRVV